jgi:hypothetical protein
MKTVQIGPFTDRFILEVMASYSEERQKFESMKYSQAIRHVHL